MKQIEWHKVIDVVDLMETTKMHRSDRSYTGDTNRFRSYRDLIDSDLQYKSNRFRSFTNLID